MWRSVSAAAFVGVLLAASPASADDLREKANAVFKPLPSTIPAVKDNRITKEKIELGKALFFDPRLSASGVFSCNSCHNLATGGDDNLETSIGHGWQKGPRDAPTAFNAVFNEAQFWDGRAEDLKAQAKGPIQAGVEMANTPAQVVTTLKSMPQYVAWFTTAFPGEKDPVTFDNMAKAIEAFEATLLTPAPFDKYLNGDDQALTIEQKAGLDLFIDKGCAGCHSGINVGGNGYFPFGVIEKPGGE
ncbi:MAG: cytochrome C peroxidase, partial [Rhizobiales bacterium]|nr:cytochrome C peroxidase [Hyphomicrobiales bacterium]